MKQTAFLLKYIMQKLIWILILLLFWQQRIFAQSLSLRIFDNKNKPVAFASIVFISSEKGTIADEYGKFVLTSFNEQDSIKISAISFIPRIIAVKDLYKKDSIFLKTGLYALEEVVIVSKTKRKDQRVLGFYSDKNNSSFILRPGAQIGLFIPNTNRVRGYIDKLFFKLEKLSRCNCPLRMRLLKPTEKNHPGDDLLKENFILFSKDLKRKNIIELSKYSIPFSGNEIFVVLEWIEISQPCGSPSTPVISGTLKSNINSVWSNYRDRQWNKRHNTPIKDDKFMNAAFGIEISY